MKLNGKAVAERLNLRPKTLANWRSSGHGPRYYKIGSRVLYDESDLAEWLESCRRKSTFEAASPDLAVSPDVPLTCPQTPAAIVFRMRLERGEGESVRLVHEDTGALLFAGPNMDAALRWLEDSGPRRQIAKRLRGALESGALPQNA